MWRQRRHECFDRTFPKLGATVRADQPITTSNQSAASDDLGRLHDAVLLPDFIIRSLETYKQQPCIEFRGQVATYADVRDQTSQMLQVLQSQGLGVGSGIAVLSKNRHEVITNMTAAAVNGCSITPLHPMGSLDDHAFTIGAAGVHCIVFDPGSFSERARLLADQYPDLVMLGFGPNDVGEDYLVLADGFDPKPLESPDVSASDPCVLTFTGGTTGKPKGVVLPQRSWAELTAIQMAEWEFPDDLRMLIATPLSHAALTLLAPVLLRGGAFHVMEAFSPSAFFETVEREQITATLIVPVMLYALQSDARYGEADMSSVQTVFYGASPMSPTKLREAIELWGPIFFQFYGQTEAPMAIAHLKKADHDPSKPDRLASCGRPAPWVRVALLDENHQPVAAGETGEICVRSPLVMDRYKDLPEQTAETLAGGWLHTGDVGRYDSDGFLHIVDRTKDMIISGGFNVYPREIEDVLTTHPAVSIGLVIGVPDDKWGEAVKAIIVLSAEHQPSDQLTLDLQRLVKHAKGSQQAPKTIDYVTDVPLTAVGKPDKKALRSTYWDGTQRAVS